jgi:hypothetical protein
MMAERGVIVSYNAKAAARFFRKLLTKLRYVRVLITNKLASYGVAHRRLIPSVEHLRSKYLNNRAENSHQPTRQRERAMKRFHSAGGTQRFLSCFSAISPHFRPRRHRLTASGYRQENGLTLCHLELDRRPHHGDRLTAPHTPRPPRDIPTTLDATKLMTVPA